jgi:type II secretory pathway pseudopilin PulG
MIQRLANRPPHTRLLRGFTLIEATLSLVIVGLLLVAAVNTLAITRRTQKTVANNLVGKQLALDLTNEILAQSYMAPTAPDVFGLEPGKSNANRAQFTDVDDYNGWTESPPQDRSGNSLAGTTGWTRSVTVVWADPSTWAASSLTNTGLKLITVTASYQNVPIATVNSYRSIAWVDTIPTPSSATSNHPPTAVATANTTSAHTTLTTTLDASTSSDPDGDHLSYVWKFGDGTTGGGPTVTHTYTALGTYTATVIVYDGHGGAASASVVLTVLP